MRISKLILTVGLSILLVLKFAYAGSPESITPDNALALQQSSKAIIIDVREPNEVSLGKIKNAFTIPMSMMNNDRDNWNSKINQLHKDQGIIVYCHSGRRAEIVGTEILKKGFHVYNLGGFDAWKSKGLPVE